MKVSEFYYELPEELIAQEPAKERDASRLLVLHRNTGKIEHRIFRNVLDYMDKGDCMVLNDTRVIPARLLGRREDTGGKMEFVLLHKTGNDLWEVILKPGKRARPGARFVFGHQGELKAEIIDITDEGNRIARFEYEGIFEQVLEKVGVVPLPPYIKKRDVDTERYQTVYSRQKGSAAAPTAGLHFTADLLEKARERGIEIAYATLHIGLGTFRPVKAENVENHNMHQEFYSINREACEKINRAKKDGRRVIAVGTTSCRTIESAAGEKGLVCPASGWTGIFIYPGYKFKVMDSLITNFHLPCSTLIMLVSAFAGKDAIMRAYQEAIKERYRFYSFGDAMLIV